MIGMAPPTALFLPDEGLTPDIENFNLVRHCPDESIDRELWPIPLSEIRSPVPVIIENHQSFTGQQRPAQDRIEHDIERYVRPINKNDVELFAVGEQLGQTIQ